jgi:hypothetical protein
MAGDPPRPVALDRNELGARLVAAVPGPPAEPALISLLTLNGLRVPEAAGADIGHLGLERRHRAAGRRASHGPGGTTPAGHAAGNTTRNVPGITQISLKRVKGHTGRPGFTAPVYFLLS